ncbi:MAG TPA: hypothetical protein VKR29_11885 [Candidatus Binataceae bacterium]|nr:hypothetical protein [Candidatus Binataceae bacterium]
MASTIRTKFKRRPPRDIWRESLTDPRFLAVNQITDEDREILSDFSPLGGVKGEGDILFILDTIRWARAKK